MNLSETKPAQKYWDAVLQLYAAACRSLRMSNSNYQDFSGMILPKDIGTFISSKVPWRFQDARTSENSASKNGLGMVRRWATMSNDGLFLVVEEEEDTGRTVADVHEITGLFYNDGTVLIWEMGSPIETAKLATDWKTRANLRPIDDAHLDVVLFNVPRTVEIPRPRPPNPGSGDRPVTVQGTVRQVLRAINVNGLSVQYIGLKRSFQDAVSKSTKYSTVHDTQWFDDSGGLIGDPDWSQRSLGVIMSFERAKWQAKIKDIVGGEGGMDEMAANGRMQLERKSAYNIPKAYTTSKKTLAQRLAGLRRRM